MGKIVSNFFMSLDGVVEAPEQWHMPYFNDEMGAAIGKGMATNKAFLMGRVLYDEWAAFWPSSDDEFAGFINNHPKYVVSNSIETATWSNTTIVSGDVSQQLRELKDRTHGDLVVSGSCHARALAAGRRARRRAPSARASDRGRARRPTVRGRHAARAGARRPRGVRDGRAEPDLHARGRVMRLADETRPTAPAASRGRGRSWPQPRLCR